MPPDDTRRCLRWAKSVVPFTVLGARIDLGEIERRHPREELIMTSRICRVAEHLATCHSITYIVNKKTRLTHRSLNNYSSGTVCAASSAYMSWYILSYFLSPPPPFFWERRNRARQRADAAKQAVIATAEAEARASAREKHPDAGERGRGDAAISGVSGAGSRAAAAAAEDLQGRRGGDDDDDDDDDDGANEDVEEEEQQEGEDEVG